MLIIVIILALCFITFICFRQSSKHRTKSEIARRKNLIDVNRYHKRESEHYCRLTYKLFALTLVAISYFIYNYLYVY